MDEIDECIHAFDSAGDDLKCHATQEAIRTHLMPEFTLHAEGRECPPWAHVPRVKSVRAYDDQTAIVNFRKPWFGKQVAPFKTPKAKIGDKIITIRTVRSLL